MLLLRAQAVQHRWLDESAPQKLSPLQAAMVQQNELLGPEPLNLDDALAGAAGPDEQPKPLAPDQDAPLPDAAATGVHANGTGQLMVGAEPAVEAPAEEPDQDEPKGRAASRGRRGRAPAARGRKRKQVRVRDGLHGGWEVSKCTVVAPLTRLHADYAQKSPQGFHEVLHWRTRWARCLRTSRRQRL